MGDLLLTGSSHPFERASTLSVRERQALRRHFRRQRRALGRSAQACHAEAVSRHFFNHGLALRARVTGLYFANDGEVELAPLLARLLRMRKRIALPVVRRDGVMSMHRYRRGAPLVRNRFGIPEPRDAPLLSPLGIDLLLVPLVAFDEFGNRLGMGAGYYDRYLGRVPPSLRPRLIGVAHEVQRSPTPLPRADWDIPLHGVLTERGWQPFHK
ncbi:MAG: 5-formyltetrahydrofolate cyclo-ligase [Pseudomonadales bacterium]